MKLLRTPAVQITALLVVVAILTAGWWVKARSGLEGQYLAPELACMCGHESVLDFHDGRVHLFNSGHKILYSAGTYELVEGRWRWQLPDHGLTLQLDAGLTGIRAQGNAGRGVTFSRSFRFPAWRIDEEAAASGKEVAPLKTFAADLSALFGTPP